MATLPQNNTVGNLTASQVSAPSPFPRFELEPFPEKFTKAFPEMTQWHRRVQRKIDEQLIKMAIVNAGGTV